MQGLDGLPGDKGDDGEAGQAVSVASQFTLLYQEPLQNRFLNI